MLNREVTDASPWLTEQLDLGAYLRRIGAQPAPPSRAALDALHEAHVRAFTFDNIDVLLDQHPGVRLDAVQEKFVGRGRGGYCFEHAVLFAAALERLGYDVERRLGRVGDPAAPRTHCVVVVTIDGERLLADPGFGMSVLRPIPLADGAEDDYGGWRYRLRQVPSVRDAAGCSSAGATSTGSRCTPTTSCRCTRSTSPSGTTSPARTRPSTSGRCSCSPATSTGATSPLTHETVTVRRPGAATEHRALREGELSDWLDELDVPLTGDERVALDGVVRRLRG